MIESRVRGRVLNTSYILIKTKKLKIHYDKIQINTTIYLSLISLGNVNSSTPQSAHKKQYVILLTVSANDTPKHNKKGGGLMNNNILPTLIHQGVILKIPMFAIKKSMMFGFEASH